MVELFSKKRWNLLPLAGQWMDHPLVLACLEDKMGRAWADRADSPRSGRILIGDFCFLLGEVNVTLFRGLSYLPPSLLLLPQSEAWSAAILSYFPHATPITRYAFGKKPHFHRDTLMSLCRLPSGFSLVPIDQSLFSRILAQPWSKDLCALYSSFSQYRRAGLGYVVLYGETICAGASPYAYCSSAIEIQVDTAPTYRRRGFASACCARLILDCLGRECFPHWDAANAASAALAQKLGYPFAYQYPAFSLV